MTLFLAVGISCVALAATLLIAWFSARTERFLLSWSIGIAILGLGAATFMVSDAMPGPWVAAAGYACDVVGFAVVYAAAGQFQQGRADWGAALCFAAGGLVVVLVPFLVGLDGLGTIMVNLSSAVLLGLTAMRYWRARGEAPISLVGISTLYGLTALSFLLCAVTLMRTNPLYLGHPPVNWAENVNGVMCLVGIVGVGALSLALNQARTAQRHRDDARTDALTGLMNRRALFDRFGPQPLPAGTAIVVFDLDRFKSVNDRFGHAVGDDVLVRFADAMRAGARPQDYAARLGGEEFALVMAQVKADVAVGRAERIRALFQAGSVATPTGPLSGTVSAGVAISDASPESFEAVLLRADTALYRAKDGGRNRVVPPEIRLVA